MPSLSLARMGAARQCTRLEKCLSKNFYLSSARFHRQVRVLHQVCCKLCRELCRKKLRGNRRLCAVPCLLSWNSSLYASRKSGSLYALKGKLNRDRDAWATRVLDAAMRKVVGDRDNERTWLGGKWSPQVLPKKVAVIIDEATDIDLAAGLVSNQHCKVFTTRG